MFDQRKSMVHGLEVCSPHHQFHAEVPAFVEPGKAHALGAGREFVARGLILVYPGVGLFVL